MSERCISLSDGYFGSTLVSTSLARGSSVIRSIGSPLQPNGCKLLATTHMLKYCELAP